MKISFDFADVLYADSADFPPLTLTVANQCLTTSETN
jgi:hypothetical protein